MSTIQNLFKALFDDGEKINLRVIHDTKHEATNRTFASPSVPLAAVYPQGFPCIGINPRSTVRKLSAIKNMVIDIDGAPLPEWAADRADIICTRDETHHHLYFCFAPTGRDEFKKCAKKLLEITPGADKAVSDPERVIRLPEFAHRKNGIEGPGYKIAFIRDKFERAPIDEKFNWVKDQANVSSSRIEPGTPQIQTVTAQDSIKNYILVIYDRKPTLCAGDGRSRELFFIGLDCHMWGVELSAAIELATKISDSRYSPPEAPAVIKKQVESAYRYATGEFGAALQAGTPAAQAKFKKQFEQIQRVREKMAGWVYIHAACRLINQSTGAALTTREQIEDYISCAVGSPVSFRQLLSGAALEVCDEIEYDPQNPERIFERGAKKYFNSYRVNPDAIPRDESLQKKAAKIFEDHVKFITTTEEEKEALTDYFAFCVQNPGKKVDWTPLIISDREGLGKSAFSVLFRKIFGEHNCSTVSAHKLLSGWTDFIAEKLFVTSHEVETSETAALTELKSLITETRVSVNAKYARTYETNNCANFLLLSNKIRALKLDLNSRRFFVIVNRKEPNDRQYYNELFNAIENGAGWIYDFLLERDLSAFDAHGAAPETRGLEILAESTKSDGAAWLEEQIEQRAGVFAREIVDLAAIKQDANITADSSVTKYLTRPVIAAVLHNAGYEPREYWVSGTHKRGWFKGSDEEFEKHLASLKNSKTDRKSVNLI